MKKQKLEEKLQAYWLILEKPLTIHEQTKFDAICVYNALNYYYLQKTGKEYVPK